MRYLIHVSAGKKRVGAVVEMPSGADSDAWGLIQRLFWVLHGDPEAETWDQIGEMIRLDEDECISGVYYEHGSCGASGAGFTMVQLPGIERDLFEAACRKIHRERDVVSMNKLKVDKLVEFQRVVDTVCPA